MLMLQYLFDGEEHRVTPVPHGNTQRHSEASGYVRTKRSVLQRIREVSKISGPKEAFHIRSEENDGYLKATSASDLPCNRDQAKNYRSRMAHLRPNSKNVDSLAILLQECKRQQMTLGEDPFIRNVNTAPKLRCVLGFDWQLREIEQFCTDPQKFTIFSADPTFNLGNFNLTVTTYWHLKVVTRRDGHHPLMIGPLLISQSKTSETYNYFFGKLTALSKNLRNILRIGTDGEEALVEAMKNSMSHAIHLRVVFGHFRDNCKTRLRESNVPETVQINFLEDVFGRRDGEIFQKGTVHDAGLYPCY